MTVEQFDPGRHNFDRVMEILALSIPQPAEQARQWVPDFYAPDGRDLFVGLASDVVVGILGIVIHADGGKAEIRHIAVHPDHRRQGVGRLLVEEVGRLLGLEEVEAETGVNNAHAFYPACGFSVTSLGEKYPGVERFLCIKQFNQNTQ
jgi:ribosomal protein S18 acetylase RimI-like enzyme